MKILLTGATGFLGNNLLRALLRDGHEVSVLVRHSSDPRPTDGLDVEKVFANLDDPATLGLVANEADLVIHSAAMIQIGWSKLEASLRVNVESTRVLAEVARRKQIRMIHVSTVDTLAPGTIDRPATEEDREPRKPACSYVVSKTQAEEAFLEEVDKGLDGVIVNPGFMIGPFDWKPSSGEMMMAVAKQSPPFAPAGGCSAADVRDVAEGIVSAIQHARTGERYILGGENVTYFDLWTRMAKVVGSRSPKMKLPNWLAGVAGKFGDVAAKFGKEPQVNSAATTMGQMFHFYSSDKAKSELGYQIGSIDIALEDAWNWFQEYGYLSR